MKDIEFARYLPSAKNLQLTAQLIECYREVFADQPWNEWLKCPKCKKSWGKKDAQELVSIEFEHCGQPLVDFWRRDKVLQDIQAEILPHSSCWLALKGEQVIGFCWGYPTTTESLESKLGVKLGESSLLERLSSDTQIAAQDELGVRSKYRDRKIAKGLFARRLEDFLEQGLEVGVVRVRQSPTPSQTFLWYTQKLGYEIIGKYPKEDGRVVLGQDLVKVKKSLNQ